MSSISKVTDCFIAVSQLFCFTVCHASVILVLVKKARLNEGIVFCYLGINVYITI